MDAWLSGGSDLSALVNYVKSSAIVPFAQERIIPLALVPIQYAIVVFRAGTRVYKIAAYIYFFSFTVDVAYRSYNLSPIILEKY